MIKPFGRVVNNRLMSFYEEVIGYLTCARTKSYEKAFNVKIEMEKATWHVFATLATALGKKEIKVESSSLNEALDSLIREHWEEFKTKVFDSSENPQRHIRIYINGKDFL